MNNKTLSLTLCLLAQATAGLPAADTSPTLAQLADQTPAYLQASTLVLATLKSARPGPTGLSNPPLHTATLTLDVIQVLRGTVQPGQSLQVGHAVRQNKRPTYPTGKSCIAAIDQVRGRWRLDDLRPADPHTLALARLAASIPLGWSVRDGRLLCPWAGLKTNIWQARLVDGPTRKPLQCAITGRPALTAGPGFKLDVEPLPPARSIKWTNPDGDGLFKITVTNTTDQPKSLFPLLQDDKTVRWDESLLILCQNKAYPLPTCGPLTGTVRPVVLQPGQSLSTTVNALALDGPQWPRGGYRIEFRFCLGELSRVFSFYYKSDHHDAIRRRSQVR